MARTLSFLVRAVVLSFLMLTSARAGTMKLLTPETGWVLAGPGLMWTTDGGAHWKNITPTLSPGERIASVFFRNSQSGWVLLYSPGNGSSQPSQTLAITDNSGATWSLAQISIPRLNPRSFLLAGGGYIYFLDSLHGWMNLSLVSSAAVRGAVLVETRDGGRTWKWIDSPGRSGPIYFVDAAQGWLAGGPASKLYVTRDGAATWRAVTLQPPPQAGRAIYPSYGLPFFQNGEDGFLAVTFSGTSGAHFVVSMFATTDGGRTWKPDTVVHGPYPMGMGQPWPTAIVDSTLITGVASDQRLVLTRASRGSTLSASATIPLLQAAVTELSFVDTMDGWALLGYDGNENRLCSTSDGGNTWTDITPGRRRKSPSSPTSSAIGPSSTVVSTSTLISPTLSASGGGGGGTHTSIHIGFDTSYVMDATVWMQAWWDDSPYYDTSVYLPGSANRGADANLTSQWITTVESQGWGLMPIWFGRQAPCACSPSSPPGGCTHFASTISSTPSVAVTQGGTQADKAVNSAKNLGISGAVIYKDIENYDTSNTSCGDAVTAFVGGWVSELHKDRFSAGVYGNPDPAEYDFSQASPLPDEVWVGKYDGRVTTWGLGSLDDAKWTSDQRFHQFAGNVTEKWGPYSWTIDRDIEDAPVAGSNGSKSITWTLAGFQYPGATATNAGAINDLGPSGSFEYTGQIVGYYCVASDCSQGFLDVGGSFTSFSYPGSVDTGPKGINDVGQIVGQYEDSSGQLHGFLYVPQSGTFTVIHDPSGTGGDWAGGINDDGEIVGCYVTTTSQCNGYLDEGGTFTTVDYPNAQQTEALGINGAGEVVGDYLDSRGLRHGFVYHDGNFTTFSCKGANFTAVFGINNNGLVVGKCWSTAPNFVGFVYDSNHNTFITDSLTYQGQPAWLSGINDNAEMVGGYYTSGLSSVLGLIAAH